MNITHFLGLFLLLFQIKSQSRTSNDFYHFLFTSTGFLALIKKNAAGKESISFTQRDIYSKHMGCHLAEMFLRTTL